MKIMTIGSLVCGIAVLLAWIVPKSQSYQQNVMNQNLDANNTDLVLAGNQQSKIAERLAKQDVRPNEKSRLSDGLHARRDKQRVQRHTQQRMKHNPPMQQEAHVQSTTRQSESTAEPNSKISLDFESTKEHQELRSYTEKVRTSEDVLNNASRRSVGIFPGSSTEQQTNMSAEQFSAPEFVETVVSAEVVIDPDKATKWFKTPNEIGDG